MRKDRTVIPLVEGWEPRTWYVVEVCYSVHNKIHEALLITHAKPDSSLSMGLIVNDSYEETTKRCTEAIYIKVIRKIDTKIDNKEKLLNDKNLNMIPNK